MFSAILFLGLLAAFPATAAPPAPDVASVREKHLSALPAEKDLSIYRLDWAPTFDDARQRAEREGRPILLVAVTNSFGDLFTGHC